MLIENIGPQMDPDCTRLTGADHTVSTSTGGEYGALSMARAAGELAAVLLASNERNCSSATPSNQLPRMDSAGASSLRKRSRVEIQGAKAYAHRSKNADHSWTCWSPHSTGTAVTRLRVGALASFD